MRWEDEDYVLVDTHDTPDWISMSWQARGLYIAFVRAADGDGCVRFDEPMAEHLAAIVNWPADVVAAALPSMLEYDYAAMLPGALVLRHLIPITAQRTPRWSRAAYAEVYARDGAACRYCLATDRLTVDHVVPRCQGGRDGAENLVVACRSCNSRKNGRTPEQARMVLLPIGKAVA